MSTAVFGGGCFWCTEAVFASIEGVQSVEPGYCGGHVDSPTYEQVCGEQTGHIEVIRIVFDEKIVGYETLLDVFFATHDPTTPGRQGNDVGPQYQSAVFAQDEIQKKIAEETIERLDQSEQFATPICTLVLPAHKFWVAEQYHHNYYENNQNQGYCQFIIAPKLMKLKRSYQNILR